jgi:hypothetical protein
MIIYNVTIQVDNSIAIEWLQWMKEEHIPDVLNTGMFFDARLCHLLEQDEKEAKTYTAQYFCHTLTEYNTYISEHAQGMREKGFARFGNKFVAFRTVMEVEK